MASLIFGYSEFFVELTGVFGGELDSVDRNVLWNLWTMLIVAYITRGSFAAKASSY